MPIVREQYKVGQGGGLSIDITFDSSVSAGSLLLCAISGYDAQAPKTYTVSDDQGNSWSDIHEINYQTHDVGVMSYAMNAGAGSTTVTVTADSGTSAYFTVVIVEVSGIKTSGALDQNNYSSTSGTSWDSGNIATTQDDEYLFGVFAHDDGNFTLTEDGAWTLIFEEETQSADMPISVCERIVSSTLTESFSGTISGTADHYAGIASFEMSGAPPPTPASLLMMMGVG